MSDKTSLVFPASIDLAGLDRNLQAADSMVDEFATSAASRLGSIRAPSMSMNLGSSAAGQAGSAAGASAAQLAATLMPAGAAIGTQLAASIAASLGNASAQISRTMGSIGKVVSHQLADTAKFTRLVADINQVKDTWKSRITQMGDEFKAFQSRLHLKMAALPPGSIVPAGDLATLARLKAGLDQANAAQAAYSNSSSRALGNLKGMQSGLSVFQRKQKPYGGAGDFGKAAAGLGPIVSGLLPQGVGGMKALGSATNTAAGAAKGLGFVLTGALGPIGLLFAAGTALHNFFSNGMKGASNLNETVTRTNIVLGSASGAVKAFADDMATKFGFAKGVTLDTAASLSGLGRSLGGLQGDKLGAFSIQFTKLAAELSAFSNVDMATAADALRIGLTGNQSDLLKQRGVIMSADTEKAYAYAHGIAKVGNELTEQQKFAARTGMIMRGLGKVNNYLEDTQGSAASQTRKLWGTIENLGTAIGGVLLPVLGQGIGLLNEFGGWAMQTFTDNATVVEGWKNAFLDSFDWVIASVHNLPAAFEVARLMMVEKLMNIGEWFAVLGPNAIMVAEYIGRNWLLLIGDAFDATITGLKNLWTNWQAVGTAIGEWFADPTRGFHVDWTPLLDGFRATAEKFPELLKPTLTDMSGEIAAAAAPITDEVASRRAARALEPAAARVLPPTEFDPEVKKGGKGKKEKQLGAALELGSKEAYSSVASALSGGGDKTMDRVAKSGDRTANATENLVKLFGANPPKDRRVRKVHIA